MNTFINTFKHIRIYNVFSDESGLFRYFKVSFGSGILTLNLRNIIKNISLINFYSNQCWILSVHTHLIVFKTIQKKTLDHLCDFIKIELTNAALLFSFHEHNRYDPSDHFTAENLLHSSHGFSTRLATWTSRFQLVVNVLLQKSQFIGCFPWLFLCIDNIFLLQNVASNRLHSCFKLPSLLKAFFKCLLKSVLSRHT